ncbi:MAG: putative DNA binding domain-containing protein [Chloroflexi bacterium]|nr:putative DNA binding domain-containing protein [Chloroflexota bacterium]
MATQVPPLYEQCPSGALCPEDDEALHLLFHEGMYEEAETGLRGMLKQCPGCPKVIGQLISCLGSMGRFEEADHLVERLLPAANDDTQLSDFFRHKGAILERCFGPGEAFDWFVEAGKLAPHTKSLAQLAEVAWQLRKRGMAAKLAEQALSLGPYDPYVIRRSVNVLIKAGKLDEAASHLLKLAKRDYEMPHYHLAIADGLIRAGETKKGLALARRKARSHRESVAVACSVSNILIDHGRRDEAKPLLRRLRKLDPGGHGEYVLVSLAMLAAQDGDTEQMLLHVVEMNRLYDSADTRSLLETTVKTVTADMESRQAALVEAQAETDKIQREHEAFKTSVAGYDTTEGGTSVQFALLEGEGWHIEFKQEMPESAMSMAKEIAALSSQEDGGSIFIGIRNDAKVIGVQDARNESERDEWRKRVRNIATGIVDPPNPVTVYFNDVDGKTVVKVWVPEGKAPIYYVGGSPYIRNLDESRKATPEEVEEYMTRRAKK